MPQRFTFSLILRRGLVGAGLLALAVTACKTETEPGLELGTEYYPVEAGTYRTYDVVDSTWNSNVVGVTRYQFRERVTDSFTDAAGQLAYRVVRSKRSTTANAWQDDSVMVLNASEKTVLLTRNNRRTVEMVFPVRVRETWNLNAFNANTRDTIIAQNRSYERVGESYETKSGGKTFSYPLTVTTKDDFGVDDELANNAFYLASYRQVFAKGVGPVFRVRRRYFYCKSGDGTCIPNRSYIYLGRVRTETLVESGKL